MEKIQTKIPFSYVTIKITRSRINKGLLAIPVSLIHIFPKDSDEIYVVDDVGNERRNTFTPYTRSSRECRIGGMRDFYEKNCIQSGDELVIQVLGGNRFRVIPEKVFEHKVTEFELKMDKATTEGEADAAITKLAKFINKRPEDVLKSEFIRLANQNIIKRKVSVRQNVENRESIPLPLRKILLTLYQGRCQVSGFSFLMKTGEPYSEIHHINPLQGNHPKNLLVVSPNVHAQFTYARLQQFFDDSVWLRKVKFNNEMYSIFQIIDKLPSTYQKEVHYIKA